MQMQAKAVLPMVVGQDMQGQWVRMEADAYHATKDAMSRGGLVEMMRSPQHFLAYWHGGQDDTPALRFGRSLHEALLEPAEYRRRARVQPDFGDLRTKAAKEQRDAWRADLPRDAMIVLADDHKQISGIIDAVWAHPVASNLLQGGKPEATGLFRDPVTGVACRIRPDVLRDGVIVDIKTTQDASRNAFSKAIANYRYHVQAAFYSDGANLCGTKVDDFVFIAVEKEPPFAVAVYVCEGGLVAEGRLQYRAALDRYLHCLKSNDWPGYPAEAQSITLPQWAFTQEQ